MKNLISSRAFSTLTLGELETFQNVYPYRQTQIRDFQTWLDLIEEGNLPKGFAKGLPELEKIISVNLHLLRKFGERSEKIVEWDIQYNRVCVYFEETPVLSTEEEARLWVQEVNREYVCNYCGGTYHGSFRCVSITCNS